ncbi:hypothetical protein GALL_177370 [mine drainage metagenome]|uniref:Transposase InsH N-terminal domain-containing protein n=1 Tax=mine drainage metagenome TaxID=410659 RepID=A0A1J5RWE4_9ZZZZ
MIKVSLFAVQERETKLDKIGDALGKLAAHVDFAALTVKIDRAAPRPGRARGRRLPFATELMVRALVIQQLDNLSDEQMEYQLLDRLSFQDVQARWTKKYGKGFLATSSPAASTGATG